MNQLPDIKQAQKFSLAGITVKAFVADVYDGDTFKAVFELFGTQFWHSFRMLGYDSPEMKLVKKDIAHLDSSQVSFLREMAQKAKLDLKDKIFNQWVEIQCTADDKYGGRTLCYVFLDGENINQYMIDNCCVFPYDGGKKLTIDQQIETLHSKSAAGIK